MSNADELKKLKELMDKGILTREEFELQKSKILGNSTASISAYKSEVLVPKKKKSKGCLIAILAFLLIGMIGSIISPSSDEQPSSQLTAEEQKASILEFDARTWEAFVNMYDAHNSLMSAIDAYGEGQISKLELYNHCEEIESYFQSASTSLRFGTTDYEEEYLQVFVSAAISDQSAAISVKKYLDSMSTSDLAQAQENIEMAKQAYITIAGNRSVLLKKAGLTDGELKQKIEKDTAEL